MADRRTQQFVPPSQQGFGMVPQRQQFTAMQQHQMYPMMQQCFPTMPQGMMPQPYPAMFMAPAQSIQTPAGFAPGMMPGQRSMPPPPPYTQTLAENYRLKKQQSQGDQERMMAEQHRQSESLMRQRQFEQQQQKLRSMNTLGGSKMNADSLIESILGKSATSKPEKRTHVATAVSPTDDSFGDFMTGPTLSHGGHMTPMASNPVPSQVTTSLPLGMSGFGTMESHPKSQDTLGTLDSHPKSQDTPQTVDTADAAVGEKKDQVLAMMLQCSDFSAPSKATTFVKKRPVNESASSPRVAVTFQSSQNAAHWNASDQLTQLFTEPPEATMSSQQPAVPPSGGASKSRAHFVVPKWCTGTVPVPTIYTQVLEASVREGEIDINIVYMILIKSGLPRETLGHIWNLCNRHTPGELQTDELYLILAMVAIAQNNLSVATLDILHRCPQAPVPYLGQPVPPPPTPDSIPPQGQPAPPGGQQEPIPPAASLVNVASVPEKPSGGDLSTQIVAPPSVLSMGVTEAPSGVEENDFADFQCAAPMTESFGNFAVHAPENTAKSSVTKTASATDLIGPEDKYAAFTASLGITPQVLGVPEPLDVSTDTPQDAKPSSGFADFDNAFDDHSESTSTGEIFVTNSSDPMVSNPTDDTVTEGFTNFLAAGSQNRAADQKESASSDKFSALKSLVTNPDLFKSEPIVPTVRLEPLGGVDQKQGDSSLGSTVGISEFSHDDTAVDNDGWDDFKAASPAKIEWSDAASLQSARNSGTETETCIGWGDGPQMEDTTTGETVDHEEELAKTIMSKVSTKPRIPARSYFTRNVIGGSAPVGLGISPLDTQPPDFPPDDDNEKDFDDFGTFHSTGVDVGGAGGSISTLGYVDAFDDFTEFAKQPSSESSSFSGMKTSSSHDFTGWGDQSGAIVDDVQSMKSLDFKAYPSSKTDSSASGDNQSVSSFDIATADTSQKIEITLGDSSSNVDVADKESVESMTLKEEDSCAPGLFPKSQSDSGHHNDNEMPQKPLDMSKILTQGGLTALTSDRYSKLSDRPQESDRHICEWTRCIDQCHKVLQDANDTFNSISSSAVCQEVLSSQRGSNYIEGVTEVYKVALRIGAASKSMALINKNIVKRLKEVDLLWGNLCAFLASSPSQFIRVRLDIEALLEVRSNNMAGFILFWESGIFTTTWGDSRKILEDWQLPAVSHDISEASLQTDNDCAQQAACGVCLLSVYQVSTNSNNRQHKLTYGVRQYHSSCANFWVNCVNCTLPALKIPELL